ncbi:unnamed protein product [Symbiodinium natans]|uniref:Uncharacterized protein n=1 Tax=Symbiodinium natans TaxID=878477 RepID=A0A812J3U7_9DINO|nr:unnamed protein product [Symbiodinium natans]
MELPVWLVSSYPKDARQSRKHHGTASRRRLQAPNVHQYAAVRDFLTRSLSSCGYDLEAVLRDKDLNGQVWGWAILEVRPDEVDSLLQERSLQRRVLLEIYDYQPLLHLHIKKAVPLAQHVQAIHVGDLLTPRSQAFALHQVFADDLLTKSILTPSAAGRDETLSAFLTANLAEYAAPPATTTALQLWGPIAILAASGLWTDASMPAVSSWSSRTHALRDPGIARLLQGAREGAMQAESAPARPCQAADQEVFGPAAFQDLAGQICCWASMLLQGQAFDPEVERFRMEMAVQTLETQARMLDSVATGSVMELLPQGGVKRFNIVFLLHALWFAFDLKSDGCLREALLRSCKLLFPGTKHTFLEQCLQEEWLPLPSQSVLAQARFYLDMALMLRMRQKHAEQFDPVQTLQAGAGGAGGAMYILADSSPQGHTNWLMLQYFHILESDLCNAFDAAADLTAAALRIRRCEEMQIPTAEDDLESEARLAGLLSKTTYKHPMVPVGLGSARADLWHELHAMYHSLFLECGSPELVASVARSVTAVISDRGTEAGIPQAHRVPFHFFFPHFQAPLTVEADGDAGLPEDAQPDGPVAAQVIGQQPPPGAEEEDPGLSMQQALPVPGCLHIVHNATRNMLHAMPNFEEKAKKPFTAVVEVLHSSYTRQRFVATCLDGEGRVYAGMFATFPHTVVKWRFGTLAAVCKDLLPLEAVLRRFWDLGKMRFLVPGQANRPERAEENAGAAFGDDHPRGPNLELASEAIRSHVFWAWVRMVSELAEIVSHTENWFQSCVCHNAAESQKRLLLTHGQSCPLRSLRAPELASGAFEPFLQEISALSAAAVTLMHCRHCEIADRAWILADFEAGRQHLLFAFIMQTACWSHLPHRLCGIGHSNADVARTQAAACLRLWATYSDAERSAAHPMTKAVLSRGTLLAGQLRQFVQGVNLSNLEALKKFAARMRFIPLCEKSIEGRHAFTHKVLKKASNAGPVYISMAERMPLLVEWSKSDPELLKFLAQAAHDVFHPLQAVVTLGLSNHPDLASLIADVQMPTWRGLCSVWGSTQKHAKTCKKVVYHLDIASQFMDLSGAADFDEDSKKPKKRSVNREQFTFEERAAFQKLLETHETSRVYSVSGLEAGRVQALTRRIRDVPPDILPGESHDHEGEDDEVPFFCEFEGDAHMLSAESQPHMPAHHENVNCPDDLTVFRVVSLRPSRMKLPPMDRQPQLAWTDIAVSILPVLESMGQGDNQSLIVSASPSLPTPDSALVLSRGGFQKVVVWRTSSGLTCSWNAGHEALLPEDLSQEALQCTAEALVRVNGFPGSASGLCADAASEEAQRSLFHLQSMGWTAQAESGLWQLTPQGLRALHMSMRLVDPVPLVNLEDSWPIPERSESALLLLLKNAGFDLFEWTPNSPKPQDYPLEAQDLRVAKHLFVRQGRVTVGQAYLACMAGAFTADKDFLEVCAGQDIKTIPHVQTDAFYDRLLKGVLKSSDQQNLMFEQDGFPDEAERKPRKRAHRATKAVLPPESLDMPTAPKKPRAKLLLQSPRKAPGRASAAASFRADAPGSSTDAAPARNAAPEHEAPSSSTRRPDREAALASSHVDCLRSDHHIYRANGSRTTCSKTLSFDPEDEESKDEVIRRLKTWVIEGLDLNTREEHRVKGRCLGDRPLDELMKDPELQARKPLEFPNVGRLAASSEAAESDEYGSDAESNPLAGAGVALSDLDVSSLTSSSDSDSSSSSGSTVQDEA